MAQTATFPLSVTHIECRFYLGGAILTSEVARPASELRSPAYFPGPPASELGPPAFLLKPRASEVQYPSYFGAGFDEYAISLTFLLGRPAYLLGPWVFLLGRRT